MAVAVLVDDLRDVPISALQMPSKLLIGSMFNPVKVIPSEEGLPRDWRGLAFLVGLSRDSICAMTSSTDPTAKVLASWKEGTLGLLQDYLGHLDRWDIVDDTAHMIEADALEYRRRLESATPPPPLFSEELDKRILTTDDILRLDQGLDPQNYHAYLLYADEDKDFAMEILSVMETKYKLKLCLRDRDLVGGMFEHEAIMKLISERCHRLIVIISPSFLKSEANKFFVTFAQARGIDQKLRKVIPVMYQRCTLPPELSYYFPLEYARSGHLWNFWDKLRDSIQIPNPQRNGFSTSQGFSECDTRESLTKEFVTAPIMTESSNLDKTLIGSNRNLSENTLSQNKRCLSNPSLSKKSFSGSLEVVKGKFSKIFSDIRPTCHNKRKLKREVAVSEC